MTDTGPSQPGEIEEVGEGEELLPDLWVETATQLIYECRFFEQFVLVRPATPRLYLAIKRVRTQEFADKFEPFNGDAAIVREYIEGGPSDFIIN